MGQIDSLGSAAVLEKIKWVPFVCFVWSTVERWVLISLYIPRLLYNDASNMTCIQIGKSTVLYCTLSQAGPTCMGESVSSVLSRFFLLYALDAEPSIPASLGLESPMYSTGCKRQVYVVT